MNTNREITQRFAHMENEVTKTRRQMRATWVVALVGAASAFVFGNHKDAIAQGYGITLAQAATRIAALETKTQDISRGTDANTSRTTLRISGVNVQIVDGTDATENTQSGLGNLIIGYNELRTSSGAVNTRTGNHNLIAGVRNNYSGNGGVVFGYQNSISSVEATVTGGAFNTASSNQASVSGGIRNTASGYFSSVSGGNANIASQYAASVSGGQQNTASGPNSSVSGGLFVQQSNTYGFSAGGTYTQASPGAGTYHSP